MDRLRDRIAVITGAGRGLGAAVAYLFSREGAKVVAADIDLDAAQVTVDRIGAAGGAALSLKVDVALEADARRLMQTAADHFGGIDVLVNNAGIASTGTVVDMSEAQWDRVMAVNIKGAYLCSRYAIPHMAHRGAGSIVCISSASGVIGQRGQVAYNVSKHGLIGLVRCMALDHASVGIRVNAVCPGVMNTTLLDALSDQQLDELRAMHPMGRVGEPEEVANTVLHLASTESSFTTGAVFLVDGGLTAM